MRHYIAIIVCVSLIVWGLAVFYELPRWEAQEKLRDYCAAYEDFPFEKVPAKCVSQFTSRRR